MRCILPVILFLTLPAFAGPPPEPRITERDGRLVLELPQELHEELAIRAPLFHKFSDSDFIPEVVEYLPTLRQQGVQLLATVVGDFDGNGLADVVMGGHIAEQTKLLLILTTPQGYEFHIYDGGPFDPHTWLGVGNGKKQYGLWGYLRKVPRGKIISPYETHPLDLEGDAFESVAWGKAAVLNYWEDGKLKRYITSD